MKIKRFVIFSILLVVLIQSCIPSLHPLYTKDKIVYLDVLEGEWIDKSDSKGSKFWEFKKHENDGYLLIHTDANKAKAAFEVFVVKLGDDYFLDFFPADSHGGLFQGENTMNEMAAIHILPVHTFAKLIVKDNAVNIRMFDPEFLEGLFAHRQIRIKHEKLEGGDYLLTAKPAELQKFVEKYADQNEAYIDDLIVLNKK